MACWHHFPPTPTNSLLVNSKRVKQHNVTKVMFHLEPFLRSPLKKTSASWMISRKLRFRSASMSGDVQTIRKKPLEGYRVIECGHIVAGPFAGTILAYFGAEVIKVEPPGGDQIRDYRMLDENGTSYWWYSIGRNKKSICVDMNTKQGQKIIHDLILTSDVLIENFRPGKMEKWNLGPEVYEKEHPSLVYSRISGYGQTGPYSDRPGFASVCEAMGGFRYINGFPDRPSVRPNLSMGDTLAGLHAVLGITMALLSKRPCLPHRMYQKDLTKKEMEDIQGQVVDVSIYESVFNLLESVVPEYDATQSVRSCSGSTITGIVPSNTYSCKNDKSLVIGANTDSLYQRLLSVMKEGVKSGEIVFSQDDMALFNRLPSYDTNGKRVEHQIDIDYMINRWTSQQDVQQVMAQLQDVNIPNGLIYSVKDIFEDEHYQSRGLFEEVPLHDGNTKKKTLKIPALVPRLSKTPGGTEWGGKRLGADTRDILTEILEIPENEVEKLLGSRIIFESK